MIATLRAIVAISNVACVMELIDACCKKERDAPSNRSWCTHLPRVRAQRAREDRVGHRDLWRPRHYHRIARREAPHAELLHGLAQRGHVVAVGHQLRPDMESGSFQTRLVLLTTDRHVLTGRGCVRVWARRSIRGSTAGLCIDCGCHSHPSTSFSGCVMVVLGQRRPKCVALVHALFVLCCVLTCFTCRPRRRRHHGPSVRPGNCRVAVGHVHV